MNNDRTPTSLSIGVLARRAGVGVETIRYYEREALLPKPARHPSSGYRQYTEGAVLRLRFISRAKELGFTLKETRELLELHGGASSCGAVRSRVQEKLTQVRQKRRDLGRIEAALVTLAEACPGEGGVEGCPILAALDGGPDVNR